MGKSGALMLFLGSFLVPMIAEGYHSSNDNPEACVYTKIFTNYNRHVRPVARPGDKVAMTIGYIFRALNDIVERDETMNVVGYFRFGWTDFQLQWDPAECNGTDTIKIQAQNIWLPEFIVANSVSNYHQYTFKRDFGLWVRHDGRIHWAFGGLFSVECVLDLTHYPFDSHECSIILESWLHNTTELTVHVSEPGFDTQTQDRNPMWTLKDLKSQYIEVAKDWPAIEVTLHWQRKIAYPVFNLICPTVFILVVALGIFWLPAECGEKTSLAITVLLAFSVIQLVIMDIMPPNSDYMPNLTMLVLGVMVLSTISVLSSMLVVYMSFKPAATPVPRPLRRLLYACLARVTFLHSELPCEYFRELDDSPGLATIIAHNTLDTKGRSQEDLKVLGDIMTNLNTINIKMCNKKGIRGSRNSLTPRDEKGDEDRSLCVLEDILTNIKVLVSHQKSSAKDEDVVMEWKVLAKVVDRLIFVVCIILLVIWLLTTTT